MFNNKVIVLSLISLCKQYLSGNAFTLNQEISYTTLTTNQFNYADRRGDTHAHNASVFKNFNIFDGTRAELQLNKIVLVVDDEIYKIYDMADEKDVIADLLAEDAKVLKVYKGDGTDTLMPGLIDAHWHGTYGPVSVDGADSGLSMSYIHAMATIEAGNTLMRGFTTVRDAGGSIFGIKQAVDEGFAMGPRIYPSGALISQTAGHADIRPSGAWPNSFGFPLTNHEYNGMCVSVDGVPQVLAAVRKNLRDGATQIKLTVGGGVLSNFDSIESLQFTPEEIAAATQAAADYGTYVMTHVYTSKGIRRAIDNGVKSIEHGHLMDEETMKYIVEKGIWLSTQAFTTTHEGISPSQAKKEAAVNNGTTHIMNLAKKYKPKIAYGTDKCGGYYETTKQAHDLIKWAKHFDNAEVLTMATKNGGELVRLCGTRNPYPKKVGIIEKGAYADILIVKGNPLEEMETILHGLKVIMKVIWHYLLYKALYNYDYGLC